jgi:predicted GNAT family N-acyltransferase
MTIHISLGPWEEQNPDARMVRDEVFIIEQNIPVELEWDEMDALSVHAVAYGADGVAVGTGRLLPDGHIGRMAVRKHARGGGIGSAILAALMAEAQRRGYPAVLLNAQTYVAGFYERYGFAAEGEQFMEAGIPHICMRHTFG